MQLRQRAATKNVAPPVFGPSRRLQRAAQVSVSLHALPRGRGRALAKGMRLWRSINKTHLETLSEERFRRKEHEPPEVVGERNPAVELAPQYPVDDQRNGELRMRL